LFFPPCIQLPFAVGFFCFGSYHVRNTRIKNKIKFASLMFLTRAVMSRYCLPTNQFGNFAGLEYGSIGLSK
jgi:hypothetical protein